MWGKAKAMNFAVRFANPPARRCLAGIPAWPRAIMRCLRGSTVLAIVVLLLMGSAQVEASQRRHGSEDPFGAAIAVRLRRESKASPEGVAKNFYVAKIGIGDPEPGEQPQEFDVVFDLGSGQVVLPSVRCHSKVCSEHRRYDKWGSKKAVDVNADGHPVLEHTTPQPKLRKSGSSPMHGKKVVRDLANIGVDFLDVGSGQVKGELIRDRLCLRGEKEAESRCFELGLVVATEMTELPFNAMPNDGIVGLGLEGLTIGRDFGFLSKFGDSLTGTKAQKQFGFFLGSEPDAGGELVFGGYDPKRLANPSALRWSPVVSPEKGFWQVSITSIRVGGKTVPLCDEESCRGAVESGAAHFSLSDELGLGLEDALRDAGGREEATEAVGADGQIKPARHQRSYGDGLVNVELVLEGGAVLTLRPEDYVSSPECAGEPDSENCREQLIERHNIPDPLGRSLFILGESVLRRYYTVFDWGAHRIGFGLAAGAKAAAAPSDSARSSPASHNSGTAEAEAAPASSFSAPNSTTPQPPAEATTKAAKKSFLGATQPGTILLMQVKSTLTSIKT